MNMMIKLSGSFLHVCDFLVSLQLILKLNNAHFRNGNITHDDKFHGFVEIGMKWFFESGQSNPQSCKWSAGARMRCRQCRRREMNIKGKQMYESALDTKESPLLAISIERLMLTESAPSALPFSSCRNSL